MPTANSDYSTDYVYSTFENDSLKNVHIDLIVKTDNLQLTITSDEDVNPIDLENILKSLQSGRFSQMKCSIYKDCTIFLKVRDELYRVHLLNDEMKISQLELTKA